MADKQAKKLSDTGFHLAFERPILEKEQQLEELRELAERTGLDITKDLEEKRSELETLRKDIYTDLSAWETVQVARHADRPVTSDYIESFDDFLELHGDRVFGDDKAMVTGFATVEDRRFLLVAHRKGKNLKERMACNFGCAHPEGYRKALRKMKLAEKLGLPIVTMINTPGAYPGIGAEERGQAMAIAENIVAMQSLRVPIICIVIGEGGSGGALGVGVGDRVLMMQHSYYSVISPEGCAAILWKDGARTEDAADALRLTSKDLVGLHVVDGVIPEPVGGAHREPAAAKAEVLRTILANLAELDEIPVDELVRDRRLKFRRMGALEGRFPVILPGA